MLAVMKSKLSRAGAANELAAAERPEAVCTDLLVGFGKV
ncbi:hypothetical protein ACVWW6_000563 [Bradyrhizobium sp. USDA 3311]